MSKDSEEKTRDSRRSHSIDGLPETLTTKRHQCIINANRFVLIKFYQSLELEKVNICRTVGKTLL